MKKIVVLMTLIVTILVGNAEAVGRAMRELELSGPVKEVCIRSFELNQLSGEKKIFVMKYYFAETGEVERISDIRSNGEEEERSLSTTDIEGRNLNLGKYVFYHYYDNEARYEMKNHKGIRIGYGKLNEIGKPKNEWQILEDGKEVLLQEFEYDKQGNQIKITRYSIIDGKVTITVYKKYDEKRRLVYYRYETSEQDIEAFTNFDEITGLVIRTKGIDKRRGLPTAVSESIYEYKDFDVHGNWLKRVRKEVETGEETITTREITYYE